ncbi:MAG: MlaD family protein [Acetobacteraceae bacterium]
MKLDRNTTVGLFVLGSLVLGGTAMVLFGNFRLFGRKVQAAVVFRDAINGLTVGAPVTFRGVSIGSVEGIGIKYDPATNAAYIPVTVQLEASRATITPIGPSGGTFDVAELVKRGLRAQLQMQSYVTGQAQIDLDFDQRAPLVLHQGVTTLPEIPTRPSAFQRTREQLSDLPLRDLATNANEALQSLRALAETLQTDLPPLLASVRSTSDKSGVAVTAAADAVRDLQGQLKTTLDAISAVAVTGDQQLKQRGAELRVLLIGATQAITQARDVLTEAKGMASARGSTRQNIDTTLRDLSAAAASLRGFAADVEQNPQLLLTGRGRGK